MAGASSREHASRSAPAGTGRWVVALAMSATAMHAAAVFPAEKPPQEDAAGRPGIEVGGSLTAVVQSADSAGPERGRRSPRANDRGDLAVAVPGAGLGGYDGQFFAHLRIGQGRGVELHRAYTGTVNTTAFQGSEDASDAYAVVAQAWYRLGTRLPESAARVELAFGKMDPFAFFDQNAVADDETMQFLDNAFVHNPLLDSAGETGSDAYGFAPGVHIRYVRADGKSGAWKASLAAFGSGPGADFRGSMRGPLVIGQVEATGALVDGLSGTYRAYAWTSGHGVDFDGAFERHTGIGISVDQRVAAAIALWGRFGRQLRGHVRFDTALTAGAELGGEPWGRRDDAIGLAAGFLRTSAEYRDATADGRLAGYAASGTERVFEIYYRWRIAEGLDVTPDFQWVRRAAGDPSAPGIVIAGVRARVGF